MLYGKIVLTCFIRGTSAIVEDNIAVSPSGEALSPKEPPASTAPITINGINSEINPWLILSALFKEFLYSYYLDL